MHPNAQLIETFYRSFQNLDWQGMQACYHEDVAFSDPVFQDLQGWKAGAMWRMLCERAQDFSLEFRDVEANDAGGLAHWTARYTFAKTGRPIQNEIDASFEFKDGKIIRHTDRFNLYRWARMALGFQGLLLGWTPAVQNKIRQEAQTGLELFIKRKRLAPKA